ncbi:MAG: hypothetical protein ACI83W_000705 [Marinoscillum sp.]|jgi:hypothetical protein
MKFKALLLLVVLMYSCVPLDSTTNTNYYPTLSYENADYTNKIGMSMVYPSGQDNKMSFPATALNGSGVIIEFDLLEENLTYLHAKIIHCNANWTPSGLSDLQILTQYNEFPINDYSYSANTLIPYVSYKLNLPAPSISGNYLIVVYKEGNARNIILSRRFVVYDRLAAINTDILVSDMVTSRSENQKLKILVKYSGIANANPLREMQLVILQNQNWLSAKYNLKPTLLRADQNLIEYNPFSGESDFPGGNQFRFFDLRSIDYRGMNVSHIDKQPNMIHAYLNKDKSRSGQSYSQLIEDNNGGFVLENRDPNDSQLQSEYVLVHFELDIEDPEYFFYIWTRKNDWQKESENRMEYDPQSRSYKGSLLLKQGYYDYLYSGNYQNGAELGESSHFQTENDYQILVYYRNPFKNYDELIGLSQKSSVN